MLITKAISTNFLQILGKMETTNDPSKVQNVVGFLKKILSVKTLLCLDLILEIWTAFDLFYCGQSKQGIETTALIFAPFVAKVIVPLIQFHDIRMFKKILLVFRYLRLILKYLIFNFSC